MVAVWISVKKSFQNCKSETAAATDPVPKRSLTHNEQKRNLCSSACSRSLSNLRDVIHGSKRHTDDDKPPSYSPRSLGSSDFLNPVSHDVVLSDSTSELKITGINSKVSSTTFHSTLKPGTVIADRLVTRAGSRNSSRFTTAPDAESDSLSTLSCKKCNLQFKKVEDVEEHQASNHPVTELAEGDSSRRIVELICRTSWPKPDDSSIRIDRVLKVNNSRATLSKFEDYREKVKIRATKLSTKHPRCLADGNELLRFHATTISCPLGTNNSFVLCTMEECGLCQILRHGFSQRELMGNVGVFTASTSKKALESIEGGGRKVLVLCRVIAGRVHKPVENVRDLATQTGFDSLAGKFGQHSSIEELYLLNPIALLPCFVVIFRP